MAEKEEILKRLSKLPNVGEKRAELLYENGITSAEDIIEEGLSGLASIEKLGFSTAKKIVDSAKEEESDETSKMLEDLEKSLGSMGDEEDRDIDEDDWDELEELERDLEDPEETGEELDIDEEGWEDLERSLEDLDEDTSEGEDFELVSKLEEIMPGIDEEEPLPDMDTAKEIDRWLEEKMGIEQHIGEESVCPVCSDVVSIYDEICDTCGVEFAQEEVRCGYCGSTLDSELVKCPDCDNSLVDEKTVCPLCEGVVYASEETCPFCGAEFDGNRVRCNECKTTVPIDSVICHNCETILRQKIIEDRPTTESGPMSVKAESTEMDVDSIELQITPSYGKGEGMDRKVGGKNRKGGGRILFPFSAIVNQEMMKKALILNAINSNIGGVLIEGHRGTAKSVAVRGLSEILPPIEVVKDCRFSCNPREPDEWCWECKERFQDTTEIPIETRPVKVIDLPLNATEDRVVGTLDIEKILSEGIKAFEEGILAEVNRGILYVDEINLLDDYIVDVLLDAAAMGVVTVEREEISLTYPSKFTLVGSMNPEEGALRPQLLDRMSLNVKVKGVPDEKERIEIIQRNEKFEKNPHAFRESFQPETEELKEKVMEAMDILDDVEIPKGLDSVIAKLSVDFEVDGHRADLIMKKTAMTNAAWEGRKKVTTDDIMIAAEMALPHRMRKGPLEQKEFNKERLRRLVEDYTI